MELVLVLIFVMFILLNVVVGLIQQRAKRRAAGMTARGEGRGERQSASAARGGQPAGTGPPARAETAPDRARAAIEGEPSSPEERPGVSFLEEQNASSLFPRPEAGPRGPGPRETAAARRAQRLERAQRARKAAARPGTGPPRERRAGAAREEAVAQEPGPRVEEAPAVTAGGGYVSSPALRGVAWRRIQQLPPLKRAMVLSEVMGKPRGMEGME
jgi:hypothetical protein